MTNSHELLEKYKYVLMYSGRFFRRAHLDLIG